jgi:hypothetical protein
MYDVDRVGKTSIRNSKIPRKNRFCRCNQLGHINHRIFRGFQKERGKAKWDQQNDNDKFIFHQDYYSIERMESNK